MILKCPTCNQECEIDEEPATGQFLLCPYCEAKFCYAPQTEVNQTADTITPTAKVPSNVKTDGTEDIQTNVTGTRKESSALFVTLRTLVLPAVKKVGILWKNSEELRTMAFTKAKSFIRAGRDKTVMLWKNSAKSRAMIFTTTKGLAVSAKDKTIALWKSGRMGKTIICATALLAIYAILPSFKKDNVDSKRPEIAKSLTDLDKALAALDGQDSYHKRNNSKSAERSNVEPLKTDLGGEQKDRWLRQIFDLAQSPAANDDTINFYGFFPGMSRHDAQVLAEYYNLDGDECRIYTVGEKGVYSITLDIKAVARILKTVSRVLKTDVAVGTYEEIAQAVANAVGDLQSKGTRNVTGERWGDRTYFDEHVSQWYERASVDGTYLKLARNGMAITGNKNLMSRMPVETASAKSQRLETTKTVIQNLLNSMVDVPVKSSGLKPFKMSKCEVTQLQWTHVMGNNPSEHMSSQIGSRNSGDCPVDDVSWDDCQEFLKEFNALPEVKKTGLTFRLPTVEEWEYACRAGASDGVCKLANGREIFKTRIDEVAWIEVADDIMRPVGLKIPNAFGMFDMIGNASEWTCSWDKEYKDRCIVIGGRCDSQWNDDSDKKLWRDSESSNYKRGKLGFRLCASKDNVDGPGTGMRKFGASYKIGDHTWTYDVIDGEAIITDVSPKAGDITIPSKIGADKYPVAIVGERALSGIESGMRSGRRGSRSGRGDRSDSADATRLTIPDSVREIGEGAFARCHGLMDLTIPDSVKSIGNEAFADCGNLAKVKIGNSVTNIGEEAFKECVAMTSVTIGNGVKIIGKEAFASCHELTNVTIPDNVERIEEGAFGDCDDMTSVTIGNGVKIIGKSAFRFCQKLTNVTIPDNVERIEECAFSWCDAMTSVTIGNGVTRIGNMAFSYCNNLTSVKFGKSVSIIGEEAFYDCKNLESVMLPDSVESIGTKAFYDCSALRHVRISEHVTGIGKDAFCGCSNLKDVKAPKRFLPLKTN